MNNDLLKHKERAYYAVLSLIFCLFIYLVLRDMPSVKADIKGSLYFCINALVPSLYPFAVSGRFISESGALSFFSPLGKAFSVFTGISPNALPCYLLGLFSGFPMGAYTASVLYEKGKIKKSEAVYIIICANNAGAAFIFGVCAKTFGVKYALVLFLSQTVTSIIFSIIFRRRQKAPLRLFEGNAAELSPLTLLAGSIVKSAYAMLSVCAFTVFFSAILGILSRIIKSSDILALLSAFSEIGCAMRTAFSVPLYKGVPIAAFALGFGGLSVHMQTAALFSFERKLPLGKIITARIAFGAVNTALAAVFMQFC